VLLTGVVMMFTAVLLRDARDNSLWYLGFFAVFTSIWLFTESRMIQFFTGNSLFIGSAAYLALIVIPIPLLLYVQNAIVRRWRKAYSVACLWFVGLFVLNVVLQFSGILDFFELVVVTHLSMFISVVLIVVSLFIEYRVYGNSEVLVFLKALVLLLAFFVIEVINFYFGNYINTSVYVRVGLILFILYLGVHSLNRIRKLVDNSRRSELLEKLAYHDILTGAMNRTAYDRDLMKINFNHEFALVAIMDVNYLKQINDEFGHAAGDEAIKLTYDCLEQAFAGVGSCYRIGGDEFAAIFTDNNIELFPKQLNDFKARIAACAQTTEYAYNVAVGYACNKIDEFVDLKSFLALADARMYENKKEQKNSA
jgi:diguanylate cyclase (GGDEF)-like protein